MGLPGFQDSCCGAWDPEAEPYLELEHPWFLALCVQVGSLELQESQAPRQSIVQLPGSWKAEVPEEPEALAARYSRWGSNRGRTRVS